MQHVLGSMLERLQSHQKTIKPSNSKHESDFLRESGSKRPPIIDLFLNS